MAPPRAAATSAKRSCAPPNPSSAPPAARGSNLLLQASHDGDLRLLKRLVEALDKGRGRPREVVEAAKEGGSGALHFAARNRGLPVCRYLVEELVVDVHAVNDEGDCEIVQLLLAKGVCVDPVSVSGTPLYVAAFEGHDEAMKVLLENHSDYNKRVPGADTPLPVAITASSVKCVKLLVEAGVDVNDGLVTPLAAAANKGLTACLKCLLEAGADPNVPDPSGCIPIEIAALNGTREDVEILFPVTSCIPTVHDWTIDGIIHHAKSVSVKQG